MDVVDFNHEIFLMIMTMYLHGILGSVRIYCQRRCTAGHPHICVNMP